VKGSGAVSKTWLAALILALGLVVPTPRLHALAQAPATQSAAAESTPARVEKKDEKAEEDDGTEAFRQSPMVKTIGAKLGMSPERASSVFTLINLAVLVVLVGWFLVKTLPKTFQNRNDALQKHLVEARNASQEANSRLGSVEARLSKLDEQIATMRSQAEKEAQLEEQRMKASVEEEKKKILEAAEQEISVATNQARRQIQQYAADLAIEQAAKKLVVSAETDRLLVQEFARRLGADEGGRN
jgi:F-type H+-transporting ATPase subunit b